MATFYLPCNDSTTRGRCTCERERLVGVSEQLQGQEGVVLMKGGGGGLIAYGSGVVNCVRQERACREYRDAPGYPRKHIISYLA